MICSHVRSAAAVGVAAVGLAAGAVVAELAATAVEPFPLLVVVDLPLLLPHAGSTISARSNAQIDTRENIRCPPFVNPRPAPGLPLDAYAPVLLKNAM